MPIEQTRRRKGVAISRERGIATLASFFGCGRDFCCFLVFDFLGEGERLRDSRSDERISSVGEDMIGGDLREAEKYLYARIVVKVMKNKITREEGK